MKLKKINFVKIFQEGITVIQKKELEQFQFSGGEVMTGFEKLRDLVREDLMGKRITAHLRAADDYFHGRCVRVLDDVQQPSIVLDSGSRMITIGSGTRIKVFD